MGGEGRKYVLGLTSYFWQYINTIIINDFSTCFAPLPPADNLLFRLIPFDELFGGKPYTQHMEIVIGTCFLLHTTPCGIIRRQNATEVYVLYFTNLYLGFHLQVAPCGYTSTSDTESGVMAKRTFTLWHSTSRKGDVCCEELIFPWPSFIFTSSYFKRGHLNFKEKLFFFFPGKAGQAGYPCPN